MVSVIDGTNGPETLPGKEGIDIIRGFAAGTT